MSFLFEHGDTLLLGGTGLLAAGCLLVACSRQPLHRQRMGEAVAWALLLWLLLAPLPLPRLALPRLAPPLPSPSDPLRVSAPASAAIGMPAPENTQRAFSHAPAEPAAPRGMSAPQDGSPRPAPPALTALPPQPSGPGATRVAWDGVLAWTWLAGASLTTLWLLLGAARLRRLVHRSDPAPDWLVGLAEVPARVRVRVASQPVRPLCAGVLRPVVLLPRELCRPRHASLLRHVLRHELAHVRQGDCRTQWLFALLLPFLFFHPLLWWLRRQVRQAAEIVADEVAASASDRAAYARELLSLAEQQVPRARALGGVAVFRNGSDFYRRMEMLLRREKPLSVSCSRFRCLAHLATAGLLVGVGVSLWGVPLPSQDPVRGETTRRQIEELRAERDRLAREVEELRGMIEQRRTGWHPQPGVTWNYSAQEVEVEAGQSLEDILREFFTEVDAALIDRTLALNPGLDPDRLRVGQKIKLPTGSWKYGSTFPTTGYIVDVTEPRWIIGPGGAVAHTVQRGETVAGILRKYHGKYTDALMERLRVLNPDLDIERLRPGQEIRVPVIRNLEDWTQWSRVYSPFMQDPETGNLVLQKTYLDDAEVEAVLRAAENPLVQKPATTRSPLAHDSVLDLVTRAVELRGERDIAVARLEELQVQGQPTRIAEVEVRTAERKLDVVRRLVKGELDGAELELELTRKQMRGLDREDPRWMQLRVDVQRLELRIDTLQSAL